MNVIKRTKLFSTKLDLLKPSPGILYIKTHGFINARTAEITFKYTTARPRIPKVIDEGTK